MTNIFTTYKIENRVKLIRESIRYAEEELSVTTDPVMRKNIEDDIRVAEYELEHYNATSFEQLVLLKILDWLRSSENEHQDNIHLEALVFSDYKKSVEIRVRDVIEELSEYNDIRESAFVTDEVLTDYLEERLAPLKD